MATTAVPYTNAVPNGNVLVPAGTSLVAAPTNNMSIANAQPEKTLLYVTNTDDDTALTFTVKKGASPPALAAGLGDLAVVIAFGTGQFIGPLESGRFLQADGSMTMESTTTTGKVTAILVPRNT
jgi:hypothetical protein